MHPEVEGCGLVSIEEGHVGGHGIARPCCMTGKGIPILHRPRQYQLAKLASPAPILLEHLKLVFRKIGLWRCLSKLAHHTLPYRDQRFPFAKLLDKCLSCACGTFF